MMKYSRKTLFVTLFSLLCFSSAYSSTSGAHSKALKDVMKRRPDLEFKDPENKIKGSDICIKIPYFDSQDFGRRKKYVAIYDERGNWIYDKVPITTNIKMVPGLEDVLISQDLLANLVHIDKIITPNRVGYALKIKSLNEEGDGRVNGMVFLDDQFRRIEYDVAVNEKLVNKSVFDDLIKRYGNISILDAINYDQGKSFFVTFQYYADDTRYWARSFYDKKSGWKHTEMFYRDYLKLPITIFSFVADQGGIENFLHIMKEERNDGCEYYKLKRKDNTKIFFNEDLQTIDPETCDVIE